MYCDYVNIFDDNINNNNNNENMKIMQNFASVSNRRTAVHIIRHNIE